MIGMADAEGSDLFAVFISNEKKQALTSLNGIIQVPLWHQKASKRADGIILWDYHVICIQIKKEGSSPPQVWDLDSSLPFPSHLDHYMSDSFRPSFQLFSDYQRILGVGSHGGSRGHWRHHRHPMNKILNFPFLFPPVIQLFSYHSTVGFFRIVHAPLFLHSFASDRRHMKNSDGNWISPPPAQDPIVADEYKAHFSFGYGCASSFFVVSRFCSSAGQFVILDLLLYVEVFQLCLELIYSLTYLDEEDDKILMEVPSRMGDRKVKGGLIQACRIQWWKDLKEDFLLGTRGVSLNPIGNTLWSLRLYAISTFIVPISARDGKRNGSLYNLDEYIRMNAADAVTEVKDDTISAVFTQKYGVLVRESQLEEFFSLLSG
ncbi:Protein N-terminal glutamine amidohydrolase [Vitis vinifera]|uniref:Protein N-terminal glutamine amidohydrolase n=1 Tax=Vitis vinifera TaxID=29760 RepID=A0A438C000_VITVI|nr:Protein N-terminal glutamine amidohydrolase [Vitis vinifera]